MEKLAVLSTVAKAVVLSGSEFLSFQPFYDILTLPGPQRAS
jgi:hypothetical protein